MAGKFQIRSRKWDIGILIGSVAVLLVGIGGLFVLQSSGNASGTLTNLFVIGLGIITFLLFAGPGIVYVLRKRVKRIKDALPGGTMSWIRSHLYLPVAALLAAYAHASTVPFRGSLSSGKVLLVLGVLVSVGGMARHHLIGVQKAALNVNVAIGKLTTGQPQQFRRLVADYTDHKRTREDVDAAMAGFDQSLQEKWRKITEISDEVEKHFPRSGGQTWGIRQYKLWRALHPPLTIALFLVLGFHVMDVLGGNQAVTDLVGTTEAADHDFAEASQCAECHGEVFDEWATSTMSHAATSSINEGQLPITLAENGLIIERFDGSAELALLTGRDLEEDSQEDLVVDNAQVCIECHTPVGGSFTDDPFELLPFGEGDSPIDGNEAVTSDGVGCIVCHTMEVPPNERDGNLELVGGAVQTSGGAEFGTMYGPLFEDPNPLPVRIHGIDGPDSVDDGFWANDLETSQLCGACHNVKLDIDLDSIPGTVISSGTFDEDEVEELDILSIIEEIDDDPLALDADGDFQLDENELDDDRVQTADGEVNEDVDNNGDGEPDGGDGLIDDLVLQTTYDEWQDYVAYFDVEADAERGHELGGFTDRYADAEFTNDLDGPLGCNGCHMPLGADGETDRPVVDYAPGVLSTPDRFRREHTFVGVDYDLDAELYRERGITDEGIATILAERDALVQSAVTLEVENLDAFESAEIGPVLPVDVTVRNNLLAHSFPTGFAFARQFWLEITAVDADGNPVCLADAFVPTGEGTIIPTEVDLPCGSGFGGEGVDEEITGDEELRQCDTRAIAEELGADQPELVGVLPNLDIDFAGDSDDEFGAAFPLDTCDPWLANFQKILTDGNPDGDGVRTEVPYQPLLPDAVKIRGQVATGLAMAELQPVRVRDSDGDGVDDAAESLTVQYLFQLEDGVDPAGVVVTATMRFRHLPPYFVRDLEARQAEHEVPEGAQIDADELLAHMAVSEVVVASSEDDGEQLACAGPQNATGDPDDDGATILDCIDDGEIADALERLNLGDDGGGDGGGQFERDDEQGLGVTPSGSALALWGPLGMALLVPFAGARRRSRSRGR